MVLYASGVDAWCHSPTQGEAHRHPLESAHITKVHELVGNTKTPRGAGENWRRQCCLSAAGVGGTVLARPAAEVEGVCVVGSRRLGLACSQRPKCPTLKMKIIPDDACDCTSSD